MNKGFFNTVLTFSRAQLPVLLATLLVVIICLFGEPLYGVNDDPFLAMVGSGFGVAVQPESHLVFSHIAYGLILGALSRFIGPNAHGWVTIFCIWLSLVLMIRASLRAADLKVRFSVLLVCVGCIYLAALLSAEFTITAGVLFGAAIASCLVSPDQTPLRRYLWTSAAILALILSYLIRRESYVMGAVITMPALLLLSWRSDFADRARPIAVSVVIVALLGFASEKLAYASSSEWRHVHEYDDLRTQFTDYGRVPWLPQAPEYRQVGWSHNDYVMFTYWYTRLPIYSLDNLSLLVKKLEIPATTIATTQIRDWFGFPLTSWPLVLALCVQPVICLLLDRKRRWVGLFLILGEVAAIAAASLTGRAPMAYVWSTAIAVTLFSLCSLLISIPPRKDSFFQSASLVFAGLLGLVTAAVVCSDHAGTCRDAAEYRDWINQQREYFQGKVTVWDLGLIWEWLITPTRIYPPFPALKVASIDDINSMPVETAMLKELGIDDLAKDICTDPEMRLMCPKTLIDVIALFGEQHYGIRPVFKEAASWRWMGIYTLENPPIAEPAR